MDIPENYSVLFGEDIKKRFVGINIKFSDIYNIHKNEKTIDWTYKGVECKANFYEKEGKLFFFLELDFIQKEGLVKKILEESVSGKFIEKYSRYLTRPKNEIYENQEIEGHLRTIYRVNCRIKKNLKNLNPEKYPELINPLLNDIWSCLIKKPLGIASGIIT